MMSDSGIKPIIKQNHEPKVIFVLFLRKKNINQNSCPMQIEHNDLF